MGEESESDIEEKEKCNTRKKCRSERRKTYAITKKENRTSIGK